MYVFSTLSMIHLKNVGIFQNYSVCQFEDKVSLSLFFLKKESTKFYVNVISQKLSFIFSESSLNNYVPPPLKIIYFDEQNCLIQIVTKTLIF